MNRRVRHSTRLLRAIRAADRAALFGPSFFATRLAAFVRETCPLPQDEIGVVELHLAGGEVLQVCHVISLTPDWVVLAVFDDSGGRTDGHAMCTELVPYPLVARVTIRSKATSSGQIGFDQQRAPKMLTQRSSRAEELLERAARAPRNPPREQGTGHLTR